MVGFPRSGNTFLRHSLNEMYPEYYFTRPVHTVKFLEENKEKNILIMPIRKPEDCIASWIELKDNLLYEASGSNLYYNINLVDPAIKYYIRYFSYVLDTKNILMLNFDKFTINLEYVAKAIFDRYGIFCSNLTTAEYIKDKMFKEGAVTQIPRENKDKLLYIKDMVYNSKEIKKAKDIFYKLEDMCV